MPMSAQAKAPRGAWTAAKRKQAKCHVAFRMSALRREPKRHVSQRDFFGLHPRVSRPSVRWRCAAGLGWWCPSSTWCLASTQEEADQAPGDAVFAQPQVGSPSATCAQSQEARFQPSAWGLQATASLNAPINSAVNSASTHSAQYPRYSAVHNESAHNASIVQFTVNGSPRYSETLIPFIYIYIYYTLTRIEKN